MNVPFYRMRLALPLTLLSLAACPGDREEPPPLPPQTAEQPAPDTLDLPERTQDPDAALGPLRYEVSLADRQLYVLRGENVVRTHDVAIGQDEWPTPTGNFEIHQVDWNPRWIPPDSEWAEDREVKEPGDPENPMGRARLIFHQDYSIHGTDDLGSLGQAASHGSIRVANDVVTELARLTMDAGASGRDENWYRQAREQRSEMRQVRLNDPVPIRVYEESRERRGSPG
jgi:lipoprotein-anchoring transpeptidase ErfK/SrfK